jgi:phage replication O-like protein O
MSDPQLENGYTKIANEIIDQFCKYRLSGEEWMVLWAIIRKTYGFNKKMDKISFSQLSNMTNLKRQTVNRALKKLSSKMVIGVIKNDDSQVNSYCLNKEFKNWIPVIKKDYCNQKRLQSVIKKDYKVSSKMINTKDNTKDNTKEIQVVVDFFNKKFGKTYRVTKGRENKLRLRLNNYTLDEILQAIDNLSRSKFHRGENDRRWSADPDFILRSDEQIDKWLAVSRPLKVENRLSDLIAE